MKTKDRASPLKRAIELANGQSALAEAMNQTAHGKKRAKKYRQAHVWKWLQSGVVPPEHCPAIEEAVGVPRHELRPDIFEAAA